MKTDYGYNEDDFVERDGQMRELTVEITLCEYRNLIVDRETSDKAIEKLQEENERLRRINAALLERVKAAYPELSNAADEMVRVVGDICVTDGGKSDAID